MAQLILLVRDFVLPLFLLTRFGLLGGLTTTLVTGLLYVPLTFRSVWYANVTWIVLFLVAAIALYGFRTALGGRRAFEFTDA